MKRYCLLILLLLKMWGADGLSLEQAGISPQDPYALWNALCGGYDNDAIKALIANGADPNEKGPLGAPLHALVHYGFREDYSEEIALLLIKAGANLEAQGTFLETPLLSAFGWGKERSKTILSLLRLGANPQARNSEGETPLHYAARFNVHDGKILEELLKYTSIDVKDYAGNTPLHTAVACRNLIMVFALVHAGADLTAVNNEGKRPLDLLESSVLLMKSCHLDIRKY